MKYEFHIGDYVEMKEGGIGYISKMTPLSNGHTCLYVHFTDDKVYPYDVVASQLEFRFNRIGRYDFTQKDKNNIGLLPQDYTKPYIMSAYSLEGVHQIDIGKMANKINELIEAVNRLEDKVD